MGSRKSIVDSSVSTSRTAIFNRLVGAGGGEVQTNGWAVVNVVGFAQPEWVSPALVLDFIAQGLAEQVGDKLQLTEKAKINTYEEDKATTRYVRQIREEIPVENGEERVPRREKRTRIVGGDKVTDNVRIKLLKHGKVRGGEALFMKTWLALPDATGTILTLADAFEKAGTTQKDPLVSTRYYVKRELKSGNAQLV